MNGFIQRMAGAMLKIVAGSQCLDLRWRMAKRGLLWGTAQAVMCFLNQVMWLCEERSWLGRLVLAWLSGRT